MTHCPLQSRYWPAPFEDGLPDSFGGSDGFAVMRRLLENSLARHLTLDDFDPAFEVYELHHSDVKTL